MIIDVYFRAQLLKRQINSVSWEPLNVFIMVLSTLCNGTIGIFHMMLKVLPSKMLKNSFLRSTRLDDLFMIIASLQFYFPC